MGYHFIECNREQRFLLPEDMRDWLPSEDFCWFVIDMVDRMDLSSFCLGYNEEGVGRRAYDPRMMVALVVYSYAKGVRSSRKMEELCNRDVAFRVVAANHPPDHSTICRFRKKNAENLEVVFNQVLKLCVEQGIVEGGLVAVDGTRMEANASMDRNKEIGKWARRTARSWLEEADRIDEEEDRLYGSENPYTKAPDWLADPERRAKVIDEHFSRQREAEEAARRQEEALNRRKAEQERTGKKDGPRKKSPGEVRSRVEQKKKQVNTTDPESRVMKDRRGHLQGYNVQVAVNTDQLILAADIHQESSDAQLLHPTIEKAQGNLNKAGHAGKVEEVVADAGYMSEDNVIREHITEDARPKEESGPKLYIATGKDRQVAKELKTTPVEEDASQADEEGMSGLEKMARRLRSARGRELFKMRGTTVEPVFGQIKEIRGCRRFMLRGLGLCRGELMLICAAHNMLKLFTLQANGKGKER